MIPGFLSDNYTFSECHVDLQRLADFAGARFIQARCTRVDTESRLVFLENRDSCPLHYDLLSVDVGCSPQIPKNFPLNDDVMPVKPIAEFTQKFETNLPPASELL